MLKNSIVRNEEYKPFDSETMKPTDARLVIAAIHRDFTYDSYRRRNSEDDALNKALGYNESPVRMMCYLTLTGVRKLEHLVRAIPYDQDCSLTYTPICHDGGDPVLIGEEQLFDVDMRFASPNTASFRFQAHYRNWVEQLMIQDEDARRRAIESLQEVLKCTDISDETPVTRTQVAESMRKVRGGEDDAITAFTKAGRADQNFTACAVLKVLARMADQEAVDLAEMLEWKPSSEKAERAAAVG